MRNGEREEELEEVTEEGAEIEKVRKEKKMS